MKNKWWVTILFSVGIWFAASTFFYVFGAAVLVEISAPSFINSLLLLEISTAICLYAAMWLYRKIDSSRNALIKLGIFGTAIGLLLDTFILYYSASIFPALSSQQILSFTIWMVIAYALYLFIPLWMERNHFLLR
ncbi:MULTISPECIES: DUF5367 family protein [Bacillus cereus group]|uniref:DUF5367 family protein n=1 Tax=Bacillus cereus TaxID=1396 RepID=A0AA44TFN7_BACCE|nr:MULTISPECIES: DUF5367 family protein [Bacillus cereus group]PFA25160.1 hypothetical protein CN373_01315 [Bacillus cereus]PFN06241.1 hypothetical protein COJ55_15270 [Bacillus cereus]PFO83211.1 hypothetical protein COJ77_09900 [Bacillus cereus]PFR32523.1 hypothetical protein COK19_00920 [Bacillus cereus]PFS00036.1 hypothetical protein COK38_14080 [Bacillus cereus]